VTTLVAGQHPSVGLSAATRAAGTRIAALLNAPARTMDDSSQNWLFGNESAPVIGGYPRSVVVSLS
jgi:hypothetical protein